MAETRLAIKGRSGWLEWWLGRQKHESVAIGLEMEWERKSELAFLCRPLPPATCRCGTGGGGLCGVREGGCSRAGAGPYGWSLKP